MASLLLSPITCDKDQGLHLRAENKGLVCKLEFKACSQGVIIISFKQRLLPFFANTCPPNLLTLMSIVV